MLGNSLGQQLFSEAEELTYVWRRSGAGIQSEAAAVS
jgi:hypothetical protein